MDPQKKSLLLSCEIEHSKLHNTTVGYSVMAAEQDLLQHQPD